jgi:O-antigen ligase
MSEETVAPEQEKTFEVRPASPSAVFGKERLFYGLTGLVVISPLPFGSNRPIWWSLMALAAGLLIIAFAYDAWRHQRRAAVPLSKVLGIAAPFLLAIVWALFQALPLTPISWHHPVWLETQSALDIAVSSAVSMNPYESLTGVMRLLTYGAIFWLALQMGRDSRLAKRGLEVIVISGMIYAAYGLIAHLSGWERVLWYPKWAHEGYLTSTFANRNSYATFAGLGLVCTLALLMQQLSGILKLQAGWRPKAQLLMEMLVGQAAYLVVGTILLSTALLLTGSRAGIVATFFGILILIIGFGLAKILRPKQAVYFVGGALIFGLIFVALSGASFIGRLDVVEADATLRGQVYQLVLRAIRSSMAFGTGLGTFPEVFQMFKDLSVEQRMPWHHAHNTYLENALELGIPGAMLLIVSIGSAGELCAYGLLRRRRSRLYAPVGLAIIGLAGAHALVDFSLEIPAVTATFVYLLGLTCAQSFNTKRIRSRSKKRRKRKSGAARLMATP